MENKEFRKFVYDFVQEYEEIFYDHQKIDSARLIDFVYLNYENAKNIIEKDFEENVIEKFDYLITNSWNKKENIEVIKKGNKLDFVKIYMPDECNEFINKNWGKLSNIIHILQNQIKIIEETEKETKDVNN